MLRYFKMAISFVAFTVSSHVLALEYQNNHHGRTGCPVGRTDGGLIEALKGQVCGPSRNVLGGENSPFQWRSGVAASP